MAGTSRPISVLVVEDTPDDERLTLRAIDRFESPIEVHVARDGEEAIRYLANTELPDLILLDLKLPKVNGVEVLKSIRENKKTAGLPVVVLTSSDEQRDLAACYGLHCSAYVRKSVNYSEYMDTMKITLDFWLSVNCTPSRDRQLVSG